PDQAALHARQRVIDQGEISRNVQLEFRDDGAARRHGDGLDPMQGIAQHAAEIIDLVEYLPDDVKRRGEIRPADAKEDANGFADLRLQWMKFRQGADRTVEHEIFGRFGQQFFDIEFLAAVLAKRPFGIDLALHDIELAVDRRQPTFGLDQNESVHAVGDVVRDHRGRAVTHIKPRNERLEPDRLFLAGIGLRRRGAAARAGGGMKIDRVDHRAVAGVLEVDFDGAADAHAKERTGHLAIEGPVAKGRALGETALQFDRNQIDAHGLRIAFAYRRRNVDRSLRDVGFDDRLRRWARRDDKLSLHAGQLMSWEAAKIDESARREGRKRQRGAGASAGDARRPRGRALVRKDDVMLGAFPIQQRDLYDLSYGSGQHGIDLAVDRAADPDEHHAAVCNPRAQRITHTGI